MGWNAFLMVGDETFLSYIRVRLPVR